MTIEELDILRSKFLRHIPLFPNLKRGTDLGAWLTGHNFVIKNFYDFIEIEKRHASDAGLPYEGDRS